MELSDQEHRDLHRAGGAFRKVFHGRLYWSRVTWIHLIAGISLINTIIALTGSRSPIGCVLGTSILLTRQVKGGTVEGIAIQMLNMLVICSLFVLGYYALRGSYVMLRCATTLILLDSLILFAVWRDLGSVPQQGFAIVFRAWALASLGLAVLQLRAYRSQS